MIDLNQFRMNRQKDKQMRKLLREEDRYLF